MTAATILANEITDNHDILLNVLGKLNISEISNPTTPKTILHVP
jgi:hypothetical protein